MRTIKGLVVLFSVCFLMNLHLAYGANWGMVMLNAYIPGEFEGSFDFDSDAGEWWTAVDSDSNSTVNIQPINPGATSDSDVALQIDYSIDPNDPDAWIIIGRDFDSSGHQSIDLSKYDNVSFYVKGDVNRLTAVIANDELTGYKNFASPEMDINSGTYAKKEFSFNEFRRQGTSGSIAGFADLLRNAKVFQFRISPDSDNSGTFYTDDVVFRPDTIAPVIQPLADNRIEYLLGAQPPVNPVPGSYLVEIPITECGVMECIDGCKVWLQDEQSGARTYINESSVEFVPVAGGYILRGLVPIPSSAAAGREYDLLLDPTSLADLAGHTAVFADGSSGIRKLADLVTCGSEAPAIDVRLSSDTSGGYIQYGEILYVTVNMYDESGIDGTSIPKLWYRDHDRMVSVDFTNDSFVVDGQHAVWAGHAQITLNASTGVAVVFVDDVMDLRGNETTSNATSFVIAISLQSMVQASPLYVNGAAVVNGDSIASAVETIALHLESVVDITTFNIQVRDKNNVLVGEASQVTTNPAGPVVTASYTFIPPLDLAPGTYTIIFEAWDEASGNVLVQTQVTVTGELVNDLLSAPNPFNPLRQEAHITYYLTADADVELRIYSISGELMFSDEISAGMPGGRLGYNDVTWDGKNRFNEVVASGVYLGYLIVETNGIKKVEKVKISVLK